jgi:NAD(P)-dependent dehydrogenase (short-subunit alcohol dehydrogenase family)
MIGITSGSPVSESDLKRCTEVLEAIAGNSLVLSQLSNDDRVRLLVAAGRAIYPEREEIKRRVKTLRRMKHEAKREVDRSVRATTSIRASRRDSVFVPAPRLIGSDSEEQGMETRPIGTLGTPRDCYICKEEFTQLHHFYDALCPRCAPFNYEKRFQTASMKDRVALITGARLKIGYQSALMMLRAGAHVIVTTRFPQDAAIRYAKEPDFEVWGDRLDVHGLDLRHSPSVEAFTRFLDQTCGRLDFLINNAAQTVRRPPGFYAHLLSLEETPWEDLPSRARQLLRAHEQFKAALLGGAVPISADGTTWISEWHNGKLQAGLPVLPLVGVVSSARLSQVPYTCDEVAVSEEIFPQGRLDADLQQVDLRAMNSWRMQLADVPTAELLEVQLVNSIAPFILCSKLKPLMMRVPAEGKHIVNVSAMEGKFTRHTKTDKHPHTNMAKAALNMMTLTSARDYARFGIHMNAVDTGWVTDEDPAEISARKQKEHDFQPPLDIVDGAARVMDPIFAGLQSGKHSWGNFLKDYVPTTW